MKKPSDRDQYRSAGGMSRKTVTAAVSEFIFLYFFLGAPDKKAEVGAGANPDFQFVSASNRSVARIFFYYFVARLSTQIISPVT